MTNAGRTRIKLLIVINDFLIGGAQRLVVDLLARIDRTRFDPVLLTLFRFGDDEREYLYDALAADIPIYRLTFRGIRDLRSWSDLWRLVHRIHPDVVLANLFFSNTVMRVLSSFFRYRAITVEHNTYTEKTRLHQLVDRFLAPLSYRIIAVSKSVAAFTAKQEGIKLSKFIVIENGIDLTRLAREREATGPEAARRELGLMPGERLIVNVARIVPQKNHKLLLEGFALFTKAHPHYRLLLIGGGSDLEETKSYAEYLGLGHKAIFLGYRKDAPRFLAASDFFVSTSLIEGFGIAHVEALAAGLPVLTTKTAGPDEMIEEGVNGFFIDSYTPEAVARGLTELADWDLTPMRAAALRSVERYGIEQAVRRYEALLEAAALRHT